MGLEEEARRAVEAEREQAAQQEQEEAARQRARALAAAQAPPDPNAVEFVALLRKQGVRPGTFIARVDGARVETEGYLVRPFAAARAGGWVDTRWNIDYRGSDREGYYAEPVPEQPGVAVTVEGHVRAYVLAFNDRVLKLELPAAVNRDELLEIAKVVLAGEDYPVRDAVSAAQELRAKKDDELALVHSLRTGAQWAAFFSDHTDTYNEYHSSAGHWKHRSLRPLNSEFGLVGFALPSYAAGRKTLTDLSLELARSGRVAVLTHEGWGDRADLAQLWEADEALPEQVIACLRKHARYALGIDKRPYRETR